MKKSEMNFNLYKELVPINGSLVFFRLLNCSVCLLKVVDIGVGMERKRFAIVWLDVFVLFEEGDNNLNVSCLYILFRCD